MALSLSKGKRGFPLKLMKYDKIKDGTARLFDYYRNWLTENFFSLSFIKKWKEKRSAHTDELPEVHTGEHAETASEIPVQLSAFIESLDTVCKSAEPDFLQLGRKLQSINLDTTALTRQTFETVSRIGGESDESVLVKVRWLTRKSLADFKNCHIQVTDNLSHVNTVIVGLEDLYNVCSALEKIGMSLRVVGLNIAVESSRSAASLNMFKVVFQQIYQLSEKTVRIAESIREDTKTTCASQRIVHSKIYAGLNQLHRLANDAQRAVQDSAREIGQLMKLSLETLEQAGIHTREISQQVGEIVAGIQIHDSMNQRVMHIISALSDVRHLFAEDIHEGRDTETAGSAYSIVEIQYAQLRQTISDIDEVHHKSTQAFGRIHSEVARLIHSFSIFGSANAENGSPLEFSRLESDLSHLQQIIDQGAGLADQIQEMTAETSETAIRLADHTKHVREVSFETHLVALNAIVKAAHLGEDGKSLEVLAQEVKILSDQSDTFVSDVAEILDTISDSVRKIRKISPDPLEKADKVQEQNFPEKGFETGVSADVGIQYISHAYEQFRKESLDAFQQAEALKTEISQTISNLDFLPALSGELKRLLRELEGIGQALSLRTCQETEELLSDTDRIAERYTMRQERDIHKQIIAQTNNLDNNADEAPQDEKKDNGEKEDFDNNVELF